MGELSKTRQTWLERERIRVAVEEGKRQGKTIEQVAAETGGRINMVKNFWLQEGRARKSDYLEYLTAEEISRMSGKIVNLHEAGRTGTQISRELQVGVGTVAKVIIHHYEKLRVALIRGGDEEAKKKKLTALKVQRQLDSYQGMSGGFDVTWMPRSSLSGTRYYE